MAEPGGVQRKRLQAKPGSGSQVTLHCEARSTGATCGTSAAVSTKWVPEAPAATWAGEQGRDGQAQGAEAALRHCRICSFQGQGHLCQGSLSQTCLPWLGGVRFYKEPLKSSPSDYSILGKRKPRGLRGEQPEGWIHPRVAQASSIY